MCFTAAALKGWLWMLGSGVQIHSPWSCIVNPWCTWQLTLSRPHQLPHCLLYALSTSLKSHHTAKTPCAFPQTLILLWSIIKWIFWLKSCLFETAKMGRSSSRITGQNKGQCHIYTNWFLSVMSMMNKDIGSCDTDPVKSAQTWHFFIYAFNHFIDFTGWNDLHPKEFGLAKSYQDELLLDFNLQWMAPLKPRYSPLPENSPQTRETKMESTTPALRREFASAWKLTAFTACNQFESQSRTHGNPIPTSACSSTSV